MAFQRIPENSTPQSFDIVLSVMNDGGQVYVSSDQVEWEDNFNITVNQLEGEINVPWRYQEELYTHPETLVTSVRRKILVPDSILGGRAQFRIDYTFIQFPDEPNWGENENQ